MRKAGNVMSVMSMCGMHMCFVMPIFRKLSDNCEQPNV